MTHQQLFSINRVQSIAAADRQEVSELAARLIDDREHEDDIKNKLSICIDKLTSAAEAGELASLSRHIREIGLMVLHTDAQHSLQLACLLLQTVDQLAECGEQDENEIEQQLLPLLNEFKSSLETYTDDEIGDGEEFEVEDFESELEQSYQHYFLKTFDEVNQLNAANDFADGDDIDLETTEVQLDVDIETQMEMIDQALDDSPVSATVQPIDQDIDSLLQEINDIPDIDSLPENGMLSVFIDELVASQPKLNQLACDLVGSTSQAFQDTKFQYLELISTLSMTAEAFELAGIVKVCSIIQQNLDNAESIDADTAYLLGNWINPVRSHLLDPANDALCLEVCEYFENEAWPITLNHRQQRELLTGLTQTAEFSGDVESEIRNSDLTPQSVSLSIADDANDELVQAFMLEAPEHAEKLSQLVDQLFRLENSEGLHDIIAAAQRIAHTIKGSSHLLAIQGTANIAHQMEDIFECLDQHSIIPSKKLCSDLVRACDELQSMLDFLQGKDKAPQESQEILSSLIGWGDIIDQGNFDALASSSEIVESVSINESIAEITSNNNTSLVDQQNEQLHIEASDKDIPVSDGANLKPDETIRVSRTLLDDIFNLVGETSIALGQMQDQLKRLGLSTREILRQEQALQMRRFDLENAVSVKGLSMRQANSKMPGSEEFDSLEMDHYDEFYGVAHSYIEVVNDSRIAMKGLSHDIKVLDNLTIGQRRLNRELQELVISTRLEPVKSLSNRLQRCVRQACRMSGKLAELSIIGEHLMMDGDMLKKLADPLMHMLRNSVDHGIESKQRREEVGKNPQGKIVLEFCQKGAHIMVYCRDDGQGLDYAAIRKKGIAKGILSASDQFDEKSLSRLLLKSGFSTRDVASQLSGRGIGLDVVYNTISELKGSMDLGNNDSGGACISLKLPVTLLTNHSLLVSTKSGRYAIPSVYLEQILSPGLGEILENAGKVSYRLKDQVYRLFTLEELLSESRVNNDYSNSTILLVQGETETVAVAIDRAISSSELVIKSLGQYVQHLNSVSGMSLLGDGSLVAVLNLPYLLSHLLTGGRTVHQDLQVTEEASAIKVLIVDDSLSVRSSLSQLILDAGYQPLTARDGLEATSLIEKEHPQLVLTDLEMPRMNGLELASYIRNNQEQHLPIVMITSRNMQKHRNQAEQIGIDLYLTKPVKEDELLAAIEKQLDLLKNAS